MVTGGLTLSTVLGVLDLAGLAGLFTHPAPPAALVIVSALLGAATLTALPAAWRGSRQATATTAGTRAVSALLSVPALFTADAPSWTEAVAAVSIAVTAAAVAMIRAGNRTLVGVA